SKAPLPSGGHLLTLDQVPEWKRTNPSILTGYRPISHSYRACLASWTFIHNETMNTYSHLLLIFPVASLLLRYGLILAGKAESLTAPRTEDILVFGIFLLGALACMGFSATYHTLMSHSQEVAELTKQFDYMGITCLIYSSFVPTIYYIFTCETELMRMYMVTFTAIWAALLALFASPLANQAWTAPLRAPMFVIFAASALAPLGKGLEMYGWEHMQQMVGLSWVLAHGLTYALGLVPFLLLWPERTKPGKFDIVGTSHQLFHISVAIAATVHFIGLLKAYEFQHNHMQMTICPMLHVWEGDLVSFSG
ncbi:MAG: hypothetical protein Q9221_008259, partial [Calogaya cf. arnoldii]